MATEGFIRGTLLCICVPCEKKKIPIKYQSKHNNKTKKFYESQKEPHKTMGYAKTPLKSPKEFLKKHTRETKSNHETTAFACLDKNHKKPPVPKRNETPPIFHENKNFVAMNKLNALRKPPRKPARKLVDTRKGITRKLGGVELEVHVLTTRGRHQINHGQETTNGEETGFARA
ncbi:enkurin [Caerostris extrusa]|uniref:Enkurin n=1 Tax=Caerostris extrusa TaxID=172846 RepID=A0AAV4Q3G2_CAEEX|nr:enkurin [Caerostris extrusa]